MMSQTSPEDARLARHFAPIGGRPCATGSRGLRGLAFCCGDFGAPDARAVTG